MAGSSSWLTGRTDWKKSLESGYMESGYGNGYKILLDIFVCELLINLLFN